MKKIKYYVVWEGLSPGVYDSWEECRLQTEGYKGAKYKAFDSKEAAIEAFRGNASEHIGILKQMSQRHTKPTTPATLPASVIRDSLAVDAACSGNPGPMEYRGVYLGDGKEIFHFGPVHGTNNIGEFLAIVHALAMLDKQGLKMTIYSDSRTAISWVRKKCCKTQLERTEETEQLFQLIERAESWLKAHRVTVPIVKWETEQWGEVPADFGRK
jgi:ribonuclease HI